MSMETAGDGLNVTFTGEPLTGIGGKISRLVKVSSEDVEKQLAEDFLSFFREELRFNGLGLRRLTPRTVAIKKSQGYYAPASPMYGQGAKNSNSYTNNIGVRRLSKGVRVGVDGRKMHHSGMNMMKFATIHAEGYEGIRGSVIPARNPMAEAAKRFKVEPRMFVVGKLLARRISQLWK